MGSSDPTSLKGLFQGLVPDPCGALQGKVISASPLKIQATNDDKLIIPASLLIVPKHLTNYKAVVDIAVGDGVLSSMTTESGSHDHSGSGHSHSGGTHTHPLASFSIKGGTMTVYNGLKVGEKVHLLSLNNGKKYYILDRVV